MLVREYKKALFIALGALGLSLLLWLLWWYVFPINVTLDDWLMHIDTVLAYTQQYPLYSGLIFFFGYVLLCSFPFPFVSVVTILAGYFYGFFYGLLLVSFASVVGSCLLFLMTRYLFHRFFRDGSRDVIYTRLLSRLPPRYSSMLSSEKPGSASRSFGLSSFSTALGLRLIPAMPFSFPSILLSLGSLRLRAFYLSTQLGLLFTLVIYVNVGTALAELRVDGNERIESLIAWQNVFSIDMIIAMLLLALMPMIGTRLYTFYTSRHYF